MKDIKEPNEVSLAVNANNMDITSGLVMPYGDNLQS